MPGTQATSLRSLQGRHAASKRWNGPASDDAAREYATARLADFIERTVSSAPPLTDEQRDRLALLLRPSSSGGAAA